MLSYVFSLMFFLQLKMHTGKTLITTRSSNTDEEQYTVFGCMGVGGEWYLDSTTRSCLFKVIDINSQTGMHSLSPPGGRLQDVSVKVKSDKSLSLLRAGKSEVYNLINTVVNGPVKLLGLVTGQNQHKPAKHTDSINILHLYSL